MRTLIGEFPEPEGEPESCALFARIGETAISVASPISELDSLGRMTLAAALDGGAHSPDPRSDVVVVQETLDSGEPIVTVFAGRIVQISAFAIDHK